MIPGYQNNSAATLRLWSAHAGEVFNLADFNRGEHLAALEEHSANKKLISRALP